MPLKLIALNCTLKPGPKSSSTDRLLTEVVAEFESHGINGEIVRIADLNIKPGVTSDEGEGDDWPAIRAKIIAADILVIGTPIWMGQPSSVCKRVLERLDAFLGETDEEGRMPSYGKLACVAVVGNEDGAHHVSAEVFQALNDVGFSIAPNAVTYWVGEAMGSIDYQDLQERPEKVTNATAMMVRNTAFFAELLSGRELPAQK